MYSNIKIIVFLFFLGMACPVFAQEDEGKRENERTPPVLSLGGYEPVLFGNNFANDGLRADFGFQGAFMLNLFFPDLMIGIQLNLHQAKVTDPEATGLYDESKVSLFGLFAGYRFPLTDKILFFPKVGVGTVSYNNEKLAEDRKFLFKDEGTSVWVAPTISYRLAKDLEVYFSTTLRRDFLKIKAPDEFQNYFDHAYYLSFGAGIRILL